MTTSSLGSCEVEIFEMSSSVTPNDVHAIPVGKLFSADADTYSIPLYQRDYTWGEEQIHRLLYDVLDEAEQPVPKDYFLGNLVVAPPAETERHAEPFDVIDGQQRLTTLYILLTTLRKRAEFSELIGRLQTLTYESREKATRALRGVVDRESGEESDDDSEDSAIVKAGVIIGQLLEYPEFAARFLNAQVIEYLLTRVLLVRMPIDRSMDLNRYFEVMNTRGVQLSPVDIVKARLFGKLQDSRDRDVLNRVWKACSDMDNYVTMTVAEGDTQLRAAVFGKEWDKLPTADFQTLRSQLLGSTTDTEDPAAGLGTDVDSPMTFDKAIEFYSGVGVVGVVEGRNDDSENERFTSQITFPTFLLHVLAVRRGDGGTSHDDRQLDDKELVRRFREAMEQNTDDRGDSAVWVRAFTTDLLRIRVLFDRYVLKRDSSVSSEHESTTDSEPGGWSLTRLVRGESRNRGKLRDSPRYRATFTGGESGTELAILQRKILLLQSALRITYTSPRTMHWMTDLLRYVTEQADQGHGVTAQGVLDRIEAFASDRLAAAITPDAKRVNVGHDGFPLGFGIPRIVFTYLDYLLVEKLNRWDFTFSYRTSIEHFSPVTVDTEYVPAGFPMEGPRLLDYFGNLALVTVSANSGFSNKPAHHKAENRAACEQSLKLSVMAEKARSGQWNDADIKEHHGEMTELLRDALSRRQLLGSG